MAKATIMLGYIKVILYEVKNLFSNCGGKKRTVKKRVSDKNKRFYAKLKRIRGHRYWWKEVE